ncbi:ABATE domain-containing protein, partial [Salmonella enterica]|uniref:ABATE domain-containing protein n=1 Tax=Salmonella enterica TaxID=28901 RepID=UPI003D28474B
LTVKVPFNWFEMKNSQETGALDLEFVGGALWLDFANTAALAGVGLPDPLQDEARLRRWFEDHRLTLTAAPAIDLYREFRDAMRALSVSLAQG